MLPKFLFADNSQDNPESIYVVHTESPRCVFECPLDEDFYENHVIHWLDPEPDNGLVRENLINQAEAFLDAELENQEELYDLEEEEEE